MIPAVAPAGVGAAELRSLDAASRGAPRTDASQASGGVEREQAIEVGRQFEALLLREMASALEKTTKLAGQGGSDAGRSVYGGMISGALADATASAGGIGLADVIADALVRS